MLATGDLNSYYGRSHVLQGITIQVRKGEVTSIIGRNGTGKTTFLRSIMGLTDRTTGSILFDEREISTIGTHQRARSGIAYVPQGRQIIPDFSVRENILMGAFARTDGKREIPSLVWELFPYLVENLERPGGLLSGGQQQQLAIARALAAMPRLILLDEPNEGIQPSVVQEIERVIFRLNRDLGLTVLLVEQNVQFVREVSHRFAVMEKGKLVALGEIGDLSDELVHRHLIV